MVPINLSSPAFASLTASSWNLETKELSRRSNINPCSNAKSPISGCCAADTAFRFVVEKPGIKRGVWSLSITSTWPRFLVRCICFRPTRCARQGILFFSSSSLSCSNKQSRHAPTPDATINSSAEGDAFSSPSFATRRRSCHGEINFLWHPGVEGELSQHVVCAYTDTWVPDNDADNENWDRIRRDLAFGEHRTYLLHHISFYDTVLLHTICICTYIYGVIDRPETALYESGSALHSRKLLHTVNYWTTNR